MTKEEAERIVTEIWREEFPDANLDLASTDSALCRAIARSFLKLHEVESHLQSPKYAERGFVDARATQKV